MKVPVWNLLEQSWEVMMGAKAWAMEVEMEYTVESLVYLEVESLGKWDRSEEIIYYRFLVLTDYLIHLFAVGHETAETVL